jgi:hypothetical protein
MSLNAWALLLNTAVVGFSIGCGVRAKQSWLTVLHFTIAGVNFGLLLLNLLALLK